MIRGKRQRSSTTFCIERGAKAKWRCANTKLRPRCPAPPPRPLCDIPSGCCFFTGPWTVTRSSLRMLRRHCVLSAAAAGAPAGVVSAFAEPSGWCAGAVMDVAGCAVCASAAPSSWRIGGCVGCCGGRLTALAVHTPPSSGRRQPASLCFCVREAQAPCSSTPPSAFMATPHSEAPPKTSTFLKKTSCEVCQRRHAKDAKGQKQHLPGQPVGDLGRRVSGGFGRKIDPAPKFSGWLTGLLRKGAVVWTQMY